MNRAARRAFDQAAAQLNDAFERAGPFPGQEATPPLLADEIRQCMDICQQLDADEETLPPEEVDELGTHALECLSDLGLWAWQLKLDDARATTEDAALDMAWWIARHGGQIAVLEPVINALARQANGTQDSSALALLFDRARGIIARTPAGISDAGEASGRQLWLALHVNSAIIAARSQQAELIQTACDLLEAHFPRQCAAFYAEGLRESAKPVYGGHVRDILRERLAKWTPPD